MEKPCAGQVAFVGQGFDVGQPGPVVDGDVEVVVADPDRLVPVGHGGLAAPQPPAAAVGDPAEFLDIDMEQVTGVGAFVADAGVAAPHRLAGDRVHRGQRRHLMARQDASDGGGDQPELAGQIHRAAADPGTQRQHAGLELGAGAGGHRVGA